MPAESISEKGGGLGYMGCVEVLVGFGAAVLLCRGRLDVRARKTPSAMGERHMFPRQTKRTETGFLEVGVCC